MTECPRRRFLHAAWLFYSLISGLHSDPRARRPAGHNQKRWCFSIGIATPIEEVKRELTNKYVVARVEISSASILSILFSIFWER